ncbi:Malonyl-[acyl-carrier protein] O-methyltransferase [Planctomycetes bacterium Pla163]|uniref:Malonyl-[acyl-carrier protein] O-methyltransferase n=1 Tax=Rohdeia mirabilis TaxID=2528008 RepID=A0A518D387_9BACT|nr:Malonyl-[acyl-carrier protein] O-methyltransferase [Planctomycetes bacterium Pla163]
MNASTTADGQAPCPLCASGTSTHEVTGYDRTRPMPGSFDYRRCGGCGLLFQHPLPAPDEIAGLYPDDYSPHVGGRSGIKDKWINRVARRLYYDTDSPQRSAAGKAFMGLLFERVLGELRPPRGECRVLDVGCGSGDLLARYAELGWSAHGIEVSPHGCEVARAKGLEVHQGDVFDAPFPTGRFDLIILSHVVEHVLDPVGFLARVREFLAPGGLLVVLTPNSRALGLQRYRSCWFPLEAPRHLMLFCPRTLTNTAREAGLRLVRNKPRTEAKRWTQSRHYVRTQGQELPEDMDERARVIAASLEPSEREAGFERLVRPYLWLAAKFGRGEILELEFASAR